MIEKRYVYTENKDEYIKALNVFQSLVDDRLEVICSFSGIMTGILLGFLSSLLLVILSQFFPALNDALTATFAFLGQIFGLLLSGKIISIIVALIFFVLFLLLVFIFPFISILLGRLIGRRVFSEGRLNSFTLLLYVSEGLEKNEKISIARLFPEKWDIEVSIDEDKIEYNKFQIVKHPEKVDLQ